MLTKLQWDQIAELARNDASVQAIVRMWRLSGGTMHTDTMLFMLVDHLCREKAALLESLLHEKRNAPIPTTIC